MPKKTAINKAKFKKEKKLKQSQLTKSSQSSIKNYSQRSTSSSKSATKSIQTPSKTKSSSPYRQLKLLASVASEKMTEISCAQASCTTTAQAESLPAPILSRDNPQEILEQLKRIAHSSNLNPNFIKQAKDLLQEFQLSPYIFRSCQRKKLLDLKEDFQARRILRMCQHEFRKWRPIDILPDGNCCFNSIAVYLNGKHSPEDSSRLRIAVVAELLFHLDQYRIRLQYFCQTTDPENVEEEIIAEARSAATDHKWCGLISFAAMATVLQQPIRLIHPIINVPTLSNFSSNSHIMNSTLLPIRGNNSLFTIHVLVNGDADELETHPASWRSNHFILLIDPTETPEPSDHNSSLSDHVNQLRASSLSPIPEAFAPQDASVVLDGSICAPLISSCTINPISQLFPEPSPVANSKSDSSSSIHSASSVARQLTLYGLDDKSNMYALYSTGQQTEVTLSASQESLLPGAFLLVGNQFMSAQVIYDLFSTPNIEQKAVSRIPSGPKTNCYFIVNLGAELTDFDSHHSNRLILQDRLRDGAGSWTDYSSNNTSCYIINNGKLKWTAFNSKAPNFDLRAHRGTFSMKPIGNELPSRKSHFWFWNGSSSPAPGLAIVAYLGPPNMPHPHGNACRNFAVYQRTSHSSIEIYGKHHTERTLDIYQNQVLQAAQTESTPPRNRQQVAYSKFHHRKLCGITEPSVFAGKLGNSAEELEAAIKLMHNHPAILKSEIGRKNVRIILANDEQFMQIARFCDTGNDESTVLGIDRTFDLSSLYATVTVFKQLDLIRPTTQLSPIMLGPILLSSDATEETYKYFLTQIKWKLGDMRPHGVMFNDSNFVVGSDQEKALINAIKDVFPNATRFICCVHLQKNIRECLRKLAIPEEIAKSISKFIYKELINAKTISDFNEADLVLNEHLKEHQRADQFIPYYTEHVRPLLQSQLSTGLRIGFSSGNWTNNNAESKNAIIKYIANWRAHTIPRLIQMIANQMQFELCLIKFALSKQSTEILLSPTKENYLVETEIWKIWCPGIRQRALEYFLTGKPPFQSLFSVSADGTTFQRKSFGHIAAKPGTYSRKRKPPKSTIIRRKDAQIPAESNSQLEEVESHVAKSQSDKEEEGEHDMAIENPTHSDDETLRRSSRIRNQRRPPGGFLYERKSLLDPSEEEGEEWN